MQVPLIGYLDRFSARPGERLAAKISSQLGGTYHADLVRVRHADPNPAGPGMQLIDVAVPWAGERPGIAKPIPAGSHAEITGDLPLGQEFTLLLRVSPWLLRREPQVVLALRGSQALELSVTEAGFAVRVGETTLALAAPPVLRRWYEIAIRISGARLAMTQTPLGQNWGAADAAAGEALLAPADWSDRTTITIGGTPHFNGRIEDPLLLHGTAPVTLADPEALLASGKVIAWWDFSQGIEGEAVFDRGPHALHGRCVNLPGRAVKGSRWTGAEHAWTHAPRHYAAIHVHEDDLEDCRWMTDFEVPIPDDMPSGLYAVRLRAGEHWDLIPFFVLPPKGVQRAKIAYLANTFTCQVYANYRRPEFPDDHRRKRQSWGAFDWCGNLVTAYQLSTYNAHPDGSGIHLSSRLRPIMNMRPGFVAVPDPKGSGLRHLPADTHLTDWMEAKGIAFDIITDEDLDNEGLDLIRGYKAVVTGSHPEYHTQGTLDALQHYVNEGGRLANLGGNSFYWKVARRADRPHVVEIRRAEGGIRAWAAEPGEYYNQLDGTMGGLWRRNGRPPQMLCGVGFSSQGRFEGSHYRRMPGADDPRAAWIIAGVEGETFGGFGLSGGGAAGFELDRADPLLGTPPGAIILARSEGHQDHFIPVHEEMLTNLTTVTGEKPDDLIRAEIVYFETAKGGAVFSTGSITFCGSLSHDNYANPISRMLENVLSRFCA